MNPRRAIPTAVVVVAGAAAFLSFQSTPSAPITRSASAATIPRAAPAPATSAPPHPAPAAPSTTPPTTPPTVANTTRTIAGDAFDASYGLVQVQVTMRGSTITDVSELQSPDSHQRSVEINQQAAPLLRQEALQAQSAQIDIVSGATYTSQAYAQSLQSALDRAHG